MRAMFGLVGILLVIGVIVYWMGAPGGELDQTKKTIKTGEVLREQVSQISGHDSSTGGLAMNSATFEMLTSGGKPASLMVSDVVADGAYAHYFGLQKDDVITAIEYQGLKRSVKELDSAKDAHPFAITDAETLIERASGKDLRGWGFAAQALPAF